MRRPRLTAEGKQGLSPTGSGPLSALDIQGYRAFVKPVLSEGGWVARHRLISFFVLAFIVSWPFFLFAGATKLAWVTVIGLFGPAIAALIVATAADGRAGMRRLLGRFLIWRINPLWFAFALLFPAASYAVSSFLSP